MACRDNEKIKMELPDFNILLIDSSTILNTSKIPRGKPIVLMFFSPDCEHCQAETETLLKNMDLLKNVRVYMATIDPFDRLKVFNEYYKLYNYPNITLGRDYKFFMPIHYKINDAPYIAIYNKKKQLDTIFSGETKLNEIIEELNKLY